MLYGVDLKKIMGINVAFDIVDNTDDIEPTFAQINPDQTKTVHKRVSKKLTSETFGDFEPKPSSINKSSKMQELKEKLSQLNTNSKNLMLTSRKCEFKTNSKIHMNR